MPFKNVLLLIVCFFIFTSCKTAIDDATQINIIPVPNSIEVSKGVFVLDHNTTIQFDDDFSVSAQFLKAFILNGSGIDLSKTNTHNTIKFVKDTSLINPEAYELHIDSSQIEIRALNDQAAFYAVQTLRQLLPAEFENGSYSNKMVNINCISVEDAPAFKYRGMHLDVGRHMYSVDFIKKYIDALALLKLNTFHWHLTEDQGWRIEIKRYPKLQEIAAYRDQTLVGHYNDQPHRFDGKRYGGYYSQEQIKEIVAYAEERFVTIIPEIEMPGHSQAAIAAYPELGCTGKSVNVATKWGVFEEIYCSKDETFTFLENVLDEVMALFPSEYIHIGGDEAPKTRWKQCSQCQGRMAQEGLKDEHELQSYFISRIEQYLNSKGRHIIGWDEILEGGLAPNATVMSWRGMQGAIEAAKQGHKVVMTPTSHCYFDYYQSENPKEPLAIGGYLPLEKVYSFNPIPEELNEDEATYVLGAQGNVWTEYMSTEKQVEYMTFPRILAMSEVVWSHPNNKDFSNFTYRLENFYDRLDKLNINYANHLFEIEGDVLATHNQISYRLFTKGKSKTIRYTLNGTEPTASSEIYEHPVPIDKNLIIKAAVFNEGEKIGNTFTQSFYLHKAVGKSISIDKKAHQSYPGSGPQGIINGISGSDKRYGDKEWLGFWGEDIQIIIDLGEETKINTIETRFHNGRGQWIYAPKAISYGFGEHGIDSTLALPESQDQIVKVKITADVSTDKVILKIPNYGIIPKGKQGAGQNAWTFIDEIIIQ